MRKAPPIRGEAGWEGRCGAVSADVAAKRSARCGPPARGRGSPTADVPSAPLMSAAQRLVAPCPASRSTMLLGLAARRLALRCAPAAASASARTAMPRALHVAAAARGEAAAYDAAGEPARAPLRRTPPPRKPPAMGEAPPADGEAPAAPVRACLPRGVALLAALLFARDTTLGEIALISADEPLALRLQASPASSYDAQSGASALPLPPVAALFDRHYSAPPPTPPSPLLPEQVSPSLALCACWCDALLTWHFAGFTRRRCSARARWRRDRPGPTRRRALTSWTKARCEHAVCACCV